MGPLGAWALTAAGLGALALASSPWWALLASGLLFGAAWRRWRGLALVAWVPACLAAPVPAVFTAEAALVAGGAALCAAAWWPVPRVRVLVPLAAGLAMLAAVLASPLALVAASSDVASGLQASALLAGGVVGYALQSTRA